MLVVDIVGTASVIAAWVDNNGRVCEHAYPKQCAYGIQEPELPCGGERSSVQTGGLLIASHRRRAFQCSICLTSPFVSRRALQVSWPLLVSTARRKSQVI